MNLTDGLNPQQLQAVLHTEGPLLIIAGAGSGKTTVMTRKMAYLIQEKGIYPSSIVAVTFTNNAAKEMKERVLKLVGEEAAHMWIGTFHSICLRILRKNAPLLGYTSSFVIYDEDDTKKLLTQIAEKVGIDSRYMTASFIRSKISQLKNKMTSPEEFAKTSETDFRMQKLAEAYRLYTKSLKENNAMDFDDIILKTLELLADNTDVLDYYRRRFRYVLVDEYQDTNEPQFQLVRLLSSYHKNICVVGDDDQSIYGWRGADISNILSFEKSFENATIIKLEQNYRSTENIINSANCVIKRNKYRRSKTLFTERGEGELLRLYDAHDENDEAEFVCREIRNLIQEKQFQYGDIAVMYRTNSQSRALEDAFVKYGMNYNMVGSLRFYERKEIKDIISYLRFITNSHDMQSLGRIINTPPRGIGAKTIQKMTEYSEQEDQPLFSTMMDIKELNLFSPRINDKIEEFCNLLLQFAALADCTPPDELIDALLEQSGYMTWLEESNDAAKQDRIDNIHEFVSAAKQYTQENGDSATLTGFLEGMALSSDSDDLPKSGVKLMTIHAAKGCEFPVVFLTGLEQGLFPLSMDEEDKKEEERRLFYVGITRAKDLLYITWADSRWKYKERQSCLRSEFVDELPRDCYTTVNKLSSSSMGNPQRQASFGYVKKQPVNYSFGKPVNSVFDAQKLGTAAKPSIKYNEGDRVKHARYGEGTITRITQSGGMTVLTIQFDTVGNKQFDAALAVLKVV